MITSDATAPAKSKVRIPITPTNSSVSVNSSVIPYDARAPYINVTLKEYPYLSLYNSDRHNDRYEFKSSGLYSGCEKEHNKGKVVGREIKINAPSEMISSGMSQVNVLKA
ncbi:hypothetical protein GLOIN_2v1474727 [Rhizophagus irregularis DAOM 181602=DAOM 197198]|uniref:Uncharacterized protein n=1 Tax=Rhizophagus irregularis (strain DAOM 181602 / DAOM 197198 / MUCL 43194) TaxID=747089 RepID=A0A2P4QFE8_RHIID|nr:hypothetical protein GLOIN_2v1474727 [Rhizophagus irregularis DAOM 181602=DAOM 197198]PKY23217.1 hypothetical protein RhiirB3_387036 [Rhizophagus irregularis]PKY26696.1 hypothetical protein RhiirB3_389751 [Rhizophagus irregularis]POG76363.1 hypothetical protein GLOIN_2v1474727 [Rhizophagus irregularis DAOM 181602=DAOM 197198]|eukprot:XP_025183229.1 hypothetical protein GLOIN_2v1474727 [Rhizophagus irregularis DAOM 181602=DAOM 197198]